MKKRNLLLIPPLAVLAGTAVEAAVQIAKKPAQELPDDKDFDYYSSDSEGRKFEDLYLFLTGKSTETFTEQEAYNMLFVQADYMGHRFDCSDFRAQMLFKIYKDCGDKLSRRCRTLIRDTFLGFKYFMDEPGDDSMCYWSENHQLLFAVSEYLAGQEWPDAIFSNSGMTGNAHREKALVRIRAWMEQRFLYGFSEYLSNNYLAEDIAPMANFIAYANSPRDVENMKTVMHLLWLDVALNSVNNRFLAVSSRMYGNNKAGNYYGNSIQAAMNALWGREAAEILLTAPDIAEDEKEQIRLALQKQPNSIVMCFTDAVEKGLYVLPDAIKNIALSRDTFEVKMGCGLSADDMAAEGLIGQQPHQIMAQLGAETFTNPQVINNTIRYFKTNGMYRNAFINYFRFLDVSFLRFIDPAAFAASHNIMPHGIAIGRGNIYTYRTPLYSLSTTVAKLVDMCGAQDHAWSANIGGRLALFTTHPAGNGHSRYGSSPGYWVGNGRRPMSVQHQSVNLTVYRLPTEKRLAETGIAAMTHIYMPREYYDEFELCGDCVFARKNGVFVFIRANGPLSFKPYDPESLKGLFSNLRKNAPGKEDAPGQEFDLCRFGGDYHMYITELSDISRESYEDFKNRVRANKAEFRGDSVTYTTGFGEIAASYSGTFTVNGTPQKTEFDRYDCPFCHAERKAESITVNGGGSTLTLKLLKDDE